VVERRQAHTHPVEGARELADLVGAGVLDRFVELPGSDPLRRRLQSTEPAREEPRADVADPERAGKRERARDQQALPEEPDRGERLVQRCRNEQHRVRPRHRRHGLREPAAPVDRRSADRPTRRRGEQRKAVPLDVRGPRAPRVADDDERGRRSEMVVDDDARVRALRRALEEVGPEEAIGGKLSRQPVRCALELREPRVDEAVLERRDDDQIDEAERTGQDGEKGEAQPGADSAEPVHRSRKR
jgi:hypothetical protein